MDTLDPRAKAVQQFGGSPAPSGPDRRTDDRDANARCTVRICMSMILAWEGVRYLAAPERSAWGVVFAGTLWLILYIATRPGSRLCQW